MCSAFVSRSQLTSNVLIKREVQGRFVVISMPPPSDGATSVAMLLLRSAAVLSHVLFTGVSSVKGAASTVKGESVAATLLRNMSYSVIERGSPYSADYRVYIRE